MRRVLLDRPVLLIRDHDGSTAAIGNVCPHRFASLSNGTFEDGLVECPYHGLRFDMTGQCVHNPHGDGRIAERARVPRYPLVERHGGLWIWFGRAKEADAGAIPDLSFLDTPSPADRAPGYLLTKANYQLLSDNILDLTHADFIHRSSLGTGGELARSKAKAALQETVVTVDWSFVGKGMMMQRPLRADAEVRTDFRVTWYPAGVMILKSEVHGSGGKLAQAASTGAHIMTPETMASTHYFFENGEPTRGEKLALALEVFKGEDGVILEEVQKNMGTMDFWELEPLILANDSGAVMARRVLSGMIRHQED